MSTVTASPVPFGPLLRDWRRRRRLSQLDLALEAGVSARHVSFLETGRARPSAEMVLRLAEHLDVPLRDRNTLLVAAGHAPAYLRSGLEEPRMAAVQDAVDRLLRAHEPYPALVVDGHWGLVATNGAVPPLLDGVAPELLEPPVNALRLSLHPDGLAPRIANLPEWRTHVLERLHRQALRSGDRALVALHEELAAYPGGEDPAADLDAGAVAVPLRLRAGGHELSLLSAATTFSTAVDVTLAELSIETFFPTDDGTARALQALFDAAVAGGR
jgi:transcriptional regulator with XRE-family HTH domain